MPKDRFRKLVRSQTSTSPKLPLTHVTDAYAFTDALDGDKLKPWPCTVFKGEPLTYLFYGRPSYRANSNEEPSGLGHYLPVCILFRATAVTKIKRVFPFDSGAFAGGRYADAMHKHMKLDDFGLDPDPLTPGRVVSLFFKSVEAYVTAHPALDLKFSPTDFEALSFSALINKMTQSNTDDRGSAVELQIGDPLVLSKMAEAIIGPGPLLGDSKIAAYLKKHSIIPLPYEQLGRQKPSEHVTDIFRICREYYRHVKILPPLK